MHVDWREARVCWLRTFISISSSRRSRGEGFAARCSSTARMIAAFLSFNSSSDMMLSSCRTTRASAAASEVSKMQCRKQDLALSNLPRQLLVVDDRGEELERGLFRHA